MEHKKKVKVLKNFFFIFFAFTIFSVLPSCAGKEREEGRFFAETEEPLETASETAEEPAEPVLVDIRYDKELDWDVPVEFVFSDGTVVKRQSMYGIRDTEYLDMTGDGVDEVLLQGSFYDGRDGEFSLEAFHSTISIFQIDGREVTELSFADDIGELQGKFCEVWDFKLDRGGRKGNALHVRAYAKEELGYRLEKEMDIFYENGKWISLPKRKFEPEVSLDSDSEEAGAYEAFLRGECKAGVSKNCCNKIRYLPHSLDFSGGSEDDFYFQDMLETIISDARALHGWPVDGVENVIYGLIDCGSDGNLELVVWVSGVHIYSEYDSSSVMMVFGYRDRNVELIYGEDTWARSEAHINSDGSVCGGGSGGATLHGWEEGKIGADGVYRSAYHMLIGSGQPVGEMEPCNDFLDKDFSPVFYQCELEGETIYAYDISEDTPKEVQEDIMEYIAENEKSLGVEFMTYEKMSALCDARIKKLDISDYDDQEKEVFYQTLTGCDEFLYE